MTKLNLNAGLLKKLAGLLGLDPKTFVRDELQQLVRIRMAKRIKAIARQMQKQGWTIAQKGETEVVRDALFRLWKVIVKNGHLADIIRDSHDDHVVAALAAPVNESTPLEEVVRLAMESTLELAF